MVPPFILLNKRGLFISYFNTPPLLQRITMPLYTGKDCRIDVTGISELAILVELHNHTITSEDRRGCAVLGDIDLQEAAIGYTNDEPHFPEYLFGRPIKASLRHIRAKTFLVNCDLYDADAGPGVALDAVHKARSYREVVTP